GHLLIGGAFQVEPESVRLELGEAAAEGEDQALELLGGDHADGGIVDARAWQGVPERALAVRLLPGRCVAEGDVSVQRCVLEPGRRLDRRDDLAGDAELRKAPERGSLVGTEVPHRLVEADQALLEEILGVPAGEEVGARLQPDEARVAPDQNVECGAVPVPRAQHELEVFELPLSLLRSGCGPCGHPGLPRGSGVRTGSLTLRLRQKIARSAALYRTFAVDPA